MMYPIASIAVCVLLFSSSNVNAFNFNFKSATGIAKTAFSFINDGPVKTIISKGIGATGLKLPPLLPSVAIGAVGAALPPIINGLRSGDSLYTLLVPVFDNIRGRIGRVPFLNFIIKRQLFKNELVFKDVKMPEMKDINERLEDFLSLTGTSQVHIKHTCIDIRLHMLCFHICMICVDFYCSISSEVSECDWEDRWYAQDE